MWLIEQPSAILGAIYSTPSALILKKNNPTYTHCNNQLHHQTSIQTQTLSKQQMGQHEQQVRIWKSHQHVFHHSKRMQTHSDTTSLTNLNSSTHQPNSLKNKNNRTENIISWTSGPPNGGKPKLATQITDSIQFHPPILKMETPRSAQVPISRAFLLHLSSNVHKHKLFRTNHDRRFCRMPESVNTYYSSVLSSNILQSTTDSPNQPNFL